jgi:PAS domain S-box-containing protein
MSQGPSHIQSLPLLDESEVTYALDGELPDLSFDGVVLTDAWGTIQFVNSSWADLHGYTPDQLIGQHLGVCHSPEQIAEELNDFLATTRLVGSQEGELGHRHRDGSIFPLWQSASVLPSQSGGQNMLLFIARSMPEAEATLFSPLMAESSEPRSFFDAIPDGVLVLELSGSSGESARITDVNPAFVTISGLEKSALVGRRMVEVFPDTEPAWLEACGQVARDGAPVRIESFFHSLNMLAEVTAFRPERGQVACIFEDITEGQAAPRGDGDAEELRTLAARLLRDLESERRSLAIVLDGRIKQHLSTLAMKLDHAQRLLDARQDAQIFPILNDALAQLGEMGQTVHAVLSRIHPRILDDEGLFAALSWYTERYSRSTSLLVLLEGAPPSPRLPQPAELAIYRVVEECLSNVAQHAGATRAHVIVDPVPGALIVTIRDDGHGFDAAQLPPPHLDHGMGLIIARERAAAVGASLEVTSSPGRGTSVVVTLPQR